MGHQQQNNIISRKTLEIGLDQQNLKLSKTNTNQLDTSHFLPIIFIEYERKI